VTKTALGLLAACAILVAAVLTGCGGDDDGNGNGGQAATTLPTTVGGGSEGLDRTQWQDYQTSASAFADANQEAVAKVRTCQAQAQTNVGHFDTCVGDALSNVVEASSDLRSTLDGFEGEVGGACEAARATFSGYLRNYEATANSLDMAVSSGNSIGYSSGVQNVKTIAAAGAPARTAFEAACEPA
jgi:hypothetical protein